MWDIHIPKHKAKSSKCSKNLFHNKKMHCKWNLCTIYKMRNSQNKFRFLQFDQLCKTFFLNDHNPTTSFEDIPFKSIKYFDLGRILFHEKRRLGSKFFMCVKYLYTWIQLLFYWIQTIWHLLYKETKKQHYILSCQWDILICKFWFFL